VEREIVSLYVFSGVRQTEISKMLSMDYITVRSHYAYAIRKLKRFYKGREGNERKKA